MEYIFEFFEFESSGKENKSKNLNEKNIFYIVSSELAILSLAREKNWFKISSSILKLLLLLLTLLNFPGTILVTFFKIQI